MLGRPPFLRESAPQNHRPSCTPGNAIEFLQLPDRNNTTDPALTTTSRSFGVDTIAKTDHTPSTPH